MSLTMALSMPAFGPVGSEGGGGANERAVGLGGDASATMAVSIPGLAAASLGVGVRWSATMAPSNPGLASGGGAETEGSGRFAPIGGEGGPGARAGAVVSLNIALSIPSLGIRGGADGEGRGRFA